MAVDLDAETRLDMVDALKRGKIVRNKMCWEGAPCTTISVRPIRLQDEAEYAIDTVMRVLRSKGYDLVRDHDGR